MNRTPLNRRRLLAVSGLLLLAYALGYRAAERAAGPDYYQPADEYPLLQQS